MHCRIVFKFEYIWANSKAIFRTKLGHEPQGHVGFFLWEKPEVKHLVIQALEVIFWYKRTNWTGGLGLKSYHSNMFDLSVGIACGFYIKNLLKLCYTVLGGGLHSAQRAEGLPGRCALANHANRQHLEQNNHAVGPLLLYISRCPGCCWTEWTNHSRAKSDYWRRLVSRENISRRRRRWKLYRL